MGLIKTIERKGKRFLVRVTTSVIRTRAMTREEVLANAPRRILVVRQHHQMGDMLLAVPAFRAIKESYPEAEVTVLTGRINRDVLVNNPYVDQLLTYDISRPLGFFAVVRAMRARRFDWVIVLHTVSFSFTSALLGLLSGGRIRIGSTSAPFGNRMSEAFYHYELPLPEPDKLEKMSESEHNLYPLSDLGIHTDNLAPLIVPTETNEAWASQFVADHSARKPVCLVVHPGAGKTENIWPPERFAEVVNRIAGRLDIAVIVVEGPRDAETAQRFSGLIEAPTAIARHRPIGDAAALMRQGDLVLCNDTGVMHVASAAGARTLAVFGPTDPVRWAPRCDNLHIARSEDGTLASIDPSMVFRKAMSLLEEGSAINKPS
jgi:ADP-heptose:LPS heptosyltransferase